MIRRLLIANRGEIARRIARSARATGANVIAVYAPSDAAAPHVTEADVAVALRGTTATETYLDIDQLIAAAVATGADAVHPGYGFNSERPAFASAVIAAGLTWVGPPPSAIAAMGDKLSAKRLMAAAGVPVLPTYQLDAAGSVSGAGGSLSGDRSGLGAAGAVAWGAGAVSGGGGELPAGLELPLIVKASAGGGGKGMRIVDSLDGLAEAVAAARREAAASFGDPTVFVERYVPDARHVEIQVLADDHGHVVHCFERDCSIQRRHQKVIEEAPSPAVDADLRSRMGAAAVAAARAVGYRSAGTVEFVVDGDGGFWFLEVNTRLQVEHPVTEAVTGLDLVREQFLIAAGLPLSVTQDDLRIDGHAIEARLYAEDPVAGFLPATGTLVDWAPASDPPVRWDSGVESGSVVGVQWDPLLAKVIAHAPTRAEAALRLALALSRSRIRGVTTNRDFLVAALRHPLFLEGRATTSFVVRDDVALARPVTDAEIAGAAVTAALCGQARRRADARVLTSLPSGWRTGILPPQTVTYTLADSSSADHPPADHAHADHPRNNHPRGDLPPAGGSPAELRRAERTVTVGYQSRRDGAWDVTVTGADLAGAGADRAEGAGGAGHTGAGGAGHTGAGGAGHTGAGGAGHTGAGGADDTDPTGGAGPDHIDGSGAVHVARVHGWDGARLDLELAGRRSVAHVHTAGERWWVQGEHGDLTLREVPRFAEPEPEAVPGGLVAPMPGRVIEVTVTAGTSVQAGAVLVIVEAMKMEHRVTAPHAGVVSDVHVAPGDQVGRGDLLVVVDPVQQAA